MTLHANASRTTKEKTEHYHCYYCTPVYVISIILNKNRMSAKTNCAIDLGPTKKVSKRRSTISLNTIDVPFYLEVFDICRKFHLFL
jgi:hypothetical protein